MAERGVDRSDDNPFSFKAFINDKEKKTTIKKDIFSDDEDDIFESSSPPAASAPLSRQSQKTDKNLDFDLDASSPEDKPKDNPFSFKKFLSSSGSSSTTTTKPKATPSSYAPPDIASDIPSFRNNFIGDISTLSSSPSNNPTHMSAGITANKKESTKKNKESSLAFSAKNKKSLKNFPTNSTVDNNNRAFQLPLFGSDDVDGDDEDDFDFDSKNSHAEAVNEKRSPGGLQLPDFLSDGPLLGGRPTMPVYQREEGNTREDLLSQIQILQEENRRLREDLTKVNQKHDDKTQRITQLKSDLERQKKKEAEETAVMEKAVLQVEENLVTTTQRAVQAETAVSKLKQEVKGLQNQVRCLTAENEVYRSGDGGLSDIRERTKYTSEQLKIGAESAEKSLKDLLQGVDKMKLLSQVLASWEKITEVQPEGDESKS